MIDKAREAFRKRFNRDPEVCASAPGRVELLGNHTDYNDGFVMSVALDMKVYICASKREDASVTLYSSAYDSECTFNMNALSKEGDWADYIRGVADELVKRGGAPEGFDAVILSSVPTGTGLSSSAALEVAAAMTLKGLYPYEMEEFEIARMCRAAENNFVGMNCGILDQFSSVFGKENSALFLDCRDEEHEAIPLGTDNVSVIVCNSMKKHALVSSQYNTRRQECMDAAAYFGEKFDGIRMLRDVTPEMFEQEKDGLPENQMKRAHHVIYENQRVVQGCGYLKKGEFESFGLMMNESHASSRDYFQNSIPELDFLQETASSCDGVVGSKLSGGGFGGAVVALCRSDAVEETVSVLDREYLGKTGIKPEIHISRISDGASILSPE